MAASIPSQLKSVCLEARPASRAFSFSYISCNQRISWPFPPWASIFLNQMAVHSLCSVPFPQTSSSGSCHPIDCICNDKKTGSGCSRRLYFIRFFLLFSHDFAKLFPESNRLLSIPLLHHASYGFSFLFSQKSFFEECCLHA